MQLLGNTKQLSKNLIITHQQTQGSFGVEKLQLQLGVEEIDDAL